MDQMVEIYLRTLQSLVIDPGPLRSPSETRAFLRHWLAPAVNSFAQNHASTDR
jgi:hypothetical protein